MAALSAELRSIFERGVVQARDTAEAAAQAALTTLAVERDRPFDSMSEERRALRRALRARARQLGEGDMGAGMPRLIEEIAYEQWHRMLFARFLAENDLLMHPEGVAVTLEECAELAQEEGAEDLWSMATQYASLMLPGIFRVDDPALQVRFAPEGRHKLEQIVTDLPQAVFVSDDGLGWAYQFWQSKKKDEVNASERKIGGADIAPVTQLFTEDYMVKFLLHNTLGAWWAHRHPDSSLNKTFEYLRYREDGTPAAGTFDGWPDKVAEVTMMDPCGGSGHFVVAAFEMFSQMRMAEEGLGAAQAGDAVIRDNVHMLEIDPRCTQIAAFSLALVAWRSGGFRDLPEMNLACSGIPVKGQLEDWLELGGNDQRLRRALERLHQLFLLAPTLGSLIEPSHMPIGEQMFAAEFAEVAPLLEQALLDDPGIDNFATVAPGESAASVLNAARMLTNKYVLVVTNVPYLTSGKQGRVLQQHLERYYAESRSDLATAFLERCRDLTSPGGSYGLVIQQYYLFLGSYKGLRKQLLDRQTWNTVGRLGTGAFETISGEVVNVALVIKTNAKPPTKHRIAALESAQFRTPSEKALSLIQTDILLPLQSDQIRNPDSRVTLQSFKASELLGKHIFATEGLSTGDRNRFILYFWEMPSIEGNWIFFQSSTESNDPLKGFSEVLLWEGGHGDLATSESARVQGDAAWGRRGLLVARVSSLMTSLYAGHKFDKSCVALIPLRESDLPAVWAFARSEEFVDEIRRLDKKTYVTTSVFEKLPFDREHWQSQANRFYPEGLPAMRSSDPRQWLFEGDLANSEAELHVAVSLLLGYRWPRDSSMLTNLPIDSDGIACLASVAGEQALARRLGNLLAAAYGNEWSLGKQQELLSIVDFRGKSLTDWLMNGFFVQHCRLFGNRPFIWHIWDGRKDGFSALVNYHKLDHARLQRLIYTYLGDWINTQRAEQEQGVAGAEGRLVAALELKKKLELILEGEPPYDIYVRWKPLHEQAIGWNPDLNDGVRLNIRPFVTAGVLRSKFTIHWKKDRGKNPDGSERHNDLHFTWAQKEEARRQAGVL